MDIRKLKSNEDNPRIIDDSKFEKLVNSIKQFPEMLELRPIVIDENNIILGGNMRYRACLKAGLKDVPVKIAKGFTEEQKKEFIIKDNSNYGQWDWDILSNEWDANNLDLWGVDVWKNIDDNINLEEKEYQHENPLWFLNIEFENENEAQEWYNKLKKENLNIKIVQ